MLREFSMIDQINFAKLSGDYNKLHIDEIAARRFIFGKPAVHGIHLVLFALDYWAKSHVQPFELVSLKVNFRKPLLVGQAVELKYKEDGNRIILKLFRNDELLTDINICFTCRKWVKQNITGSVYQEYKSKRVTALDLESSLGEIDITLDPELAHQLFPELKRFMPELQIAELLALTRLVGMECPGENSLFADVAVDFKETVSGGGLDYRVLEFDRRFSKAMIGVQGPSIKGVVGAFLRPEPTQQLPFSEIKTMIRPGEFLNQSAFIVGGSRGLGEVVAKLLAAGGAKVLFTYYKGSRDAQSLHEELGREGCKIESIFFDVNQSQHKDMSVITSFSPTHFYYFATANISAGTKSFSQELFNDFCAFYVAGFSSTLNSVEQASARLTHVFYPSSVFVADCPGNFAEYSAAKAAGEEQCAMHQQRRKDLRFYAPRLPKMSTDQTQSMYGQSTVADAAPVMLRHLRVFANTAQGVVL